MATAPPDELNPFRPPVAAIGATALADRGSDVESIRLAHLKHEGSVKLVGALAYGGAGVLFLFTAIAVAMAAGVFPGMEQPGGNVALTRLTMAMAAGVYLVGTVLGGATGFGLRRLQAWSRWLALVLVVLLAAFLLFWFVMLALFNAQMAIVGSLVLALPLLILGTTVYLLASPRANVVFSAEYHAVIRQTPHLRPRLGVVLRTALGLVGGIIVLVVIVVLARTFG